MAYDGAFAEFVVAREERLARIEAAAARQAREVARIERFVERFRYKASKARQVQSRVKTLEKLERVQVPSRSELAARFAFPEPPRSSRVVAELTDATVGYPDGDGPVVSGATLAVERGQTVALVGPNGAGKTTLLKLILGELSPTAGGVRIGATCGWPPSASIRPTSWTAPSGPSRCSRPASIRGGATCERCSARSASGRRRRPAGGGALRWGAHAAGSGPPDVEPVNLLVLDEPTNHLDLPSCDILEDALGAYPGTVLLVTHDRHLIRAVADSLIEVRHGRAVWHLGADESVLFPQDPQEQPAPGTDATPAPGRPRAGSSADRAERRRASARARAATSKLRRRVADLERAWAAADAEVAELHSRLSDPAVYGPPEEVHALAAAHTEAAGRAATLLAEWEASLAELETLGSRPEGVSAAE